MKKSILFLLASAFSSLSFAQTQDSVAAKPKALTIGGYAEVEYIQPLAKDDKNYNAKLDVHRMVVLLGYAFNAKTQFVSEVEFEHVTKLYVEQCYLQHQLHPSINLRAGLMLIPMGIINELHEPPTYNGVSRTLIDNVIVPTTWREIGAGFEGKIIPASIKYQLYAVNGFLSHDGTTGKLSGSKPLRDGRQRGAESTMSSPNAAGRVEYFGLRGLTIGFSGYWGKTQSSLYNNLDKNDAKKKENADASVVGLAMTGLDARYAYKGLQLRGQANYASISNTEAYNTLTATTKDGKTTKNDLGSALIGYYGEIGYNIFRLFPQCKQELVPFARYEAYNTQHEVEGDTKANDANNVSAITAGLTWHLAKGAVIKTDFQLKKSKADDKFSKTLSAGIGVMF